jgi:hypothetical protein
MTISMLGIKDRWKTGYNKFTWRAGVRVSSTSNKRSFFSGLSAKVDVAIDVAGGQMWGRFRLVKIGWQLSSSGPL